MTWRTLARLTLMAAVMAQASWLAAVSDPNDAEGAKDPPLFSRMPGFHIYHAEVKDFDRFEFPVGPDRTNGVEGRSVAVIYYANDGRTLPSALQIARNYENAARAIGGSKVYAYEDGGHQYVTLRVATPTAETWAFIDGAGNGMYNIHVVERQLMKQDVVANADSLAGSIRDTGKVAVYGIYFDTDRADIKPESGAALTEIAKLLKANPAMKLYVVGHTDNAGKFEHNLTLSQARAQAVTNALATSYGIATPRLRPYGVGPTAPLASNHSEEGRAKNRRVELVEQ